MFCLRITFNKGEKENSIGMIDFFSLVYSSFSLANVDFNCGGILGAVWRRATKLLNAVEGESVKDTRP